ncbi:MAG TPA: tRNA (pseudouridine(54)-N(1))-methyltransferase TrmY [Candidatus Paceibacterota bacterium]|nr:tRNA (pseudouridine(54)-N(1))-methyltransferase TrmY [Candidatus Paceibacterota bacterium]
MREFVFFSNQARTSGNFDTKNLMDAGRMDIAVHVLIHTFFISHKLREDTKLHFIFNGQPDPPKHIMIFPKGRKTTGSITISKKDVANLIRKMLFKYKEGKKIIVEDGYEIEKKSLFKVVDEMLDEGKELYVLDAKGEDIRDVKIGENPVFILGDSSGFASKELKKLKTKAIPVSIGNMTYFASQVVTIVNNELDRRGI